MSPFMFAFAFEKGNHPYSFETADLAFEGQYVTQIYDTSNNTYSRTAEKIDL